MPFRCGDHELHRRQYGKALEALQALREGAADNRDKAPDFNRVLRDLAAEFEAHPQHRAWWCVSLFSLQQGILRLQFPLTAAVDATSKGLSSLRQRRSSWRRTSRATCSPLRLAACLH